MCTCIAGRNAGQIYLANNEDIPVPCGMLFSNQQGIPKKALMMPPDTPACWTSRFGSLTFSQCGKEFPSGGMNECGLIIEQTTLRETLYPATDARPAIKELQMIQYLLDCCQTAHEALEQMAALRIAQASAQIHFMLLDKTGNCAVVAYVDGKMQSYQGETLPYTVLTNTHYPEALAYYLSAGKAVPSLLDEYASNSLKRFCTALDMKQEITYQPLNHDDIFRQLEAVKRSDTLWQIIYDPLALTIAIQTRQSPARKLVELSTFDFSMNAKSKAFDLQKPSGGRIAPDFSDYTTALNRHLIQQFFNHDTIRRHLAPDIPDHLLEYLAAYPEQMAAASLHTPD